MRNIFYAPNSLFSPESEVVCAKAMTQIDAGVKDITVINCAGGASCSINPLGLGLLCKLCMRKSDQYFGIVEAYAEARGVKLTREKINFHEHVLKKIDLCADIKSINYEGSDIGYAALSTYIGFTRDYEPNIDRKGSRHVIGRLLATAVDVHDWFSDFCKYSRESDQFFLFNGRLNNSRPALRAITAAGLSCTCLEVAGRSDRLVEFENVLPHDINANLKVINSLYSSHADQASDIADKYFSSKMNGEAINDRSYVSGQIASKLPEDFDPRAENITIFGSSEDELKAIGKEWEYEIYLDQIDAVKRIAQMMSGYPGINLYYRVHPNVKTTPKKYRRRIEAINEKGLTVIPAESDISSYALMMASDKVVTFGSTIGVEASYWGKPSILVGKSFYMDTGSTYNPRSEDELSDLLTKPLPALPKQGAIKMAVFYTENGYKNSHFSGNHSDGFTLGERKITLSYFERVSYLIAKTIEKSWVRAFVR